MGASCGLKGGEGMTADQKRVRLYALAAAAGVALVSIFFMLGPPGLLARSETPLFCGSCHVMEDEFEAWFHAGAHRGVKCVDCHLPNENMALHYTWKSIDGLKDVIVFYSGMVPERINITAHGREVVRANCIRCHQGRVEMINQERLCWECHRRLSHRQTGLIQTL
jgi:cytochrome c nitrite reductase small subunit